MVIMKRAWKMHFSAPSQLNEMCFVHQRIMFQRTKGQNFHICLRLGWERWPPPLGQPDRKQMWKCWPFFPWNMILWCTKHISFHCEGAEKCILHALFMITNWNYVLWRLLILLISTHPFILSIYQISDFWSKIRFRIHVIIIQGKMHPLKRFHKKWP